MGEDGYEYFAACVDNSKLMALRLVSFYQSRSPGLWTIPSSISQLGLVVYQSRLSGAVDNVLFFENCNPDISVLPYN